MALLTIVPISKTPVDLTASLVAADVAGDSLLASSNIMFYAKNGDGSAHTITISAPVALASCGGFGELAVEDIVITLPATTGEQAFVIPIGYSANGVFNLAYDDVTSVTIGAFSLS